MLWSFITSAYQKLPLRVRLRVYGFRRGCARLVTKLAARVQFVPIRVGNAPLSLHCEAPVPPRPSGSAIGSAEASTSIANFPVEWFEPRDLLTPQRFDFAAKHIYARLRGKNVNSDWGRSVYAFHLSIWNKFFEDFPRKVSEAEFLESFHRIISDTRQATDRGLSSLVPLARNGTPLNGAHRIVAALLSGKSVACTKTEVSPAWADWDHRFFEGLAASAGHLKASDLFDAMALEFCRMLPNIAIAVKFPAAKGRDEEVDRILSEHATLFYRKAVTFENDAPVHLMRSLYEKEPWLGTYENDFDGARWKAGRCFIRRGPAHFFLLACDDKEDLMRAKARVRDLFGVSNHSMHITDTRDEALRVAKLAFSNSSIGFVNGRCLRGTPTFDNLLLKYRNALTCVDDSDDFCIDGSGVMAAHGIRDCADLDYISHGDQRLPLTSDTLISSHNEYGKHYGEKTLDDIIFHHCNHFYLEGMKFASLANLREWKRARGERKDQLDVALIDAFLATSPLSQVSAGVHWTALHLRDCLKSTGRYVVGLARGGG